MVTVFDIDVFLVGIPELDPMFQFTLLILFYGALHFLPYLTARYCLLVIILLNISYFASSVLSLVDFVVALVLGFFDFSPYVKFTSQKRVWRVEFSLFYIYLYVCTYSDWSLFLWCEIVVMRLGSGKGKSIVFRRILVTVCFLFQPLGY